MMLRLTKVISGGMLVACFMWGCQPERGAPAGGETLFTAMPARYTGVDFANDLTFDKDFNIYTYRNYYNGGGIALGDVNGDGLIDLYFSGNMRPNRLYLNRGDFQFEDVTEEAGVAGQRAWSTGVSMADVNGDGHLDIYVCNSGDIEGDNKQNELFINNGDGVFSEQAEAYGLADRGYSTHAAFFDYDRDGDLDVYLLNNSYQAIGSFNLRKNMRPKRDPVGGDKLYRNDGGRFVDVSAEAGIYGSVIGFGLGVTVGDLNRDGWQDIYVSNDFFERDYLYINQQDGTFRETLEEKMRSISAASMGADMADFNNDGLPDLFVTDMLPEPDARLKTKTTFENWDKYQYNLRNGYYHQFTRNMLQLNNGDGTFSEVGRLANVEATDWSWGALFFDMDNDGRKDIFVANGIFQDLTDQDFLNFIANEETRELVVSREGVNFKKLVEVIPSNPVPNYAFRNEGDLQFTNRADEWGLGEPSFSNGSAYGDLDNDGDLDLVINNVNSPASLFRSEVNRRFPERHYLQFELVGEGDNSQALGAKITLFVGDTSQYLEHMPMRGFQSSMDYRPHFGLGGAEKVDTVVVEWPDGAVTVLQEVAADQTLRVAQAEAGAKLGSNPPLPLAGPVLQDITDEARIEYDHRESFFVDFDRDRLLYHMRSTEGPALAVADVNGDGREDIFLGGAKDQPSALLLQLPGGGFRASNTAVFAADQLTEDVAAAFFDADGDGDLDLYAAAGSNEVPNTSSGLRDRLYFNDGRGGLTRSGQILPAGRFESTGCVAPADFDGDGDIDLFVGARQRPFVYGVPADGYLLANDGAGNFSDVTKTWAPELKKRGLFTSACWFDLEGDGDLDLAVAGEWMPVLIFRNESKQGQNRFTNITEAAGLAGARGWWHCLIAGDFDGDGRTDLLAGNHGLNSRFRATPEHPVVMHVNDFDQNGTVEQIISVFDGQGTYPLVLRHNLVMQLPSLKKQYLKYENFAEQTIEDYFTPEQLSRSVVQKAEWMATSVLYNRGDGVFDLQALPAEAQFAPVYAALAKDVTGDGRIDLLLGGNLYGAKPEVGRYDASYGLLLEGTPGRGFRPLSPLASGLSLEGEVRGFAPIRIAGENAILVARNNQGVRVLRPAPKPVN